MEQIDFRNITMCFSKATLAAGTTTTISTTGTTTFCIGGKFYTKSAITNGATPTTDVNTGSAFVGVGANEGSVFVYMFDKDGNLKCAQGEVVDLDAGANFVTLPEFPRIDTDTYAPFAYLLIKVDSTGSSWVQGTGNQSGATGVTYTRQDIAVLPARPQSS